MDAFHELYGEEPMSRDQISEEMAYGARKAAERARREREKGMYLTPAEISRRWLDGKMIAAWKRKNIVGDPPPFIQRAFDREGARLLRGMMR
jgi:hypothetical protein